MTALCVTLLCYVWQLLLKLTLRVSTHAYLTCSSNKAYIMLSTFMSVPLATICNKVVNSQLVSCNDTHE